MKEKNEAKGLGKLFANIKAFFSRKKKEQPEQKIENELTSLETLNESRIDARTKIDVTTDSVLDQPQETPRDSESAKPQSRLDTTEIIDTDEVIDTDETTIEPEQTAEKPTLTPQQEYIANRNMNVSAPETTIRSFIAKLSLADKETQEFYSELKNYVLSFKGTRCRTSWQYDSFYKTRILLARFVIRGKSLWLYVALTPDEIPQGTNCSFTKDRKYQGIEAGIKIQGQRTFKQSKTLLRLACEKIGLTYAEKESVSYIPESMTEEEMLEKGLIKKILTSTNVKPDID